MSTLQEVSHRPDDQDQKTRPWVLIAIAVVAVLAIAAIGWFAFNDDGTSDIEVATELADTFAQGWVDNDPELVGSVLTDDAIYSTEEGNWVAGRARTKEETMQDVRNRGDAVLDIRRVSELTPTDHGTFTWAVEITFDGKGTYAGVFEIELDGNLASRIESLSLNRTADS